MKRIILVLLISIALFSVYDRADSSESDFLQEGAAAPDFSLQDQNGEKFSLSNFNSRLVFVTFIYTSCPHECPLILTNRKLIQKSIEERLGQGLIFVAITVDPERDKPEILKEFGEKMGLEQNDLYLLSGEPDDVKKVLKKYKVKVAKLKETGEVVGHPNLGYVVNRKGLIEKVMLFAF